MALAVRGVGSRCAVTPRASLRRTRVLARASAAPDFAHESSLRAMGLAPRARARDGREVVFTTSATCPYAHRVWLALVELGVEHEKRVENLEAKSEAFKGLFARASPDAGANASVPILEHGGAAMVESALVLKYVSETFDRGAEKSLKAEGVRGYYGQLFADTFQQCVPIFFKMLRATSEAELKEAEEALVKGLQKANRVLELGAEARAGGPYACGEQFTTCDIMVMTFVPRLEIVLAHYRGFNLRKALKDSNCSALEKWMAAVSERPSLVQTLGEVEKMTGKTKSQAFIDHFAKFVTWRTDKGTVAA